MIGTDRASVYISLIRQLSRSILIALELRVFESVTGFSRFHRVVFQEHAMFTVF